LLFGTGAGYVKFQSGKFVRHGIRPGLLDGPIWSFLEDQEGNLWIGSNGLRRFTPHHDGAGFKDESLTTYTTNDGLPHQDVLVLSESRDGGFWIGTRGGLARWQAGRVVSLAALPGASLPISSLVEDREGTVWIVSNKALYQFTPHHDGAGFKDGRFTHYNTKNGLFDDVVSRILEDDRGNLWMSGNRGIFRVSRKELNDFADGKIKSFTCVSYGVADGMKTSECNGGGQPAGWKTRDGKLWFPTVKGVAIIDPNNFNSLPPPVAIEELRIADCGLRIAD
jgi:streptogramin lyase